MSRAPSPHPLPAPAEISRSSAPQCRCCGSSRLTLKGRKTGQFIRREFEFHQCSDCGFTFVEPFSGFAIYDNAYYRGEGPDPYVDYETEYRDWRNTDRMLELEDLFRIAEAQVARTHAGAGEANGPTTIAAGCGSSVVLGSAPSGSCPPRGTTAPLRWLDFGCGAGALLKFLRERGRIAGRPLELTGHDVGSYAERLQRDDGFRILDWQQLSSEPAETYDVISMIEVIEHLPEPMAALALVARLLKPGGLLLLTTGNLGSPIARRQGIHYRYCAPEIHVSLFNPHCLAELYRRVGLAPVAVRYDGVVQFKVVKSLRRRPAVRRLAQLLLRFPPFVRLIDLAYGVSAMPCATKAV